MKKMKFRLIVTVMLLGGITMLTSCSDDDIIVIPTPSEEPVVINCVKPDYLVAGDRHRISHRWKTLKRLLTCCAHGGLSLLSALM